MYVTRQNTQQAKEQRQESFDSRAHTWPKFYEPITELPHWRNYVKLVHEIEEISSDPISEQLETDDWFPSSYIGEFNSQK